MAPAEAPVDTTVAIEAPEQIRFRYRLAGPAQRAAAHLIDLALIGLVLAVLGMVLVLGAAAAPGGGAGLANAETGLALLLLFGLQWGYFALFEGMNHGRTPGKVALSLRVVKAGGEPVGVVDAVLRNLLRAADLLPFGYAAGLVAMLLDGRFRRLGDLAAGTMVVVEDRLRVAVPLHISPPTPDEARALPPRVVLDAEELRAIELFLRRAAELGPALAAELAAGVAPALGAKHGYRHPDPIRLLALLYLRATAPVVAPKLAAPRAAALPPPQGSR